MTVCLFQKFWQNENILATSAFCCTIASSKTEEEKIISKLIFRPVSDQGVKGQTIANQSSSKQNREHHDPDACVVAVAVARLHITQVEAQVGADEGQILAKVKSCQTVTIVNFHNAFS